MLLSPRCNQMTHMGDAFDTIHMHMCELTVLSCMPSRPYWYTAVAFAAASVPFLIAKCFFIFPTEQLWPPTVLLVASLLFTLAHLGTARCLIIHRCLLVLILLSSMGVLPLQSFHCLALVIAEILCAGPEDEHRWASWDLDTHGR